MNREASGKTSSKAEELAAFEYCDLNTLIVSVCAASLAAALILEYVYELPPCPLCMLQRFALIALGGVATVAMLCRFSGRLRRLSAALKIVLALIGAGFASRQVWLQHLPPEEVPGCLPGFDYLIDALPLTEALLLMVQGSSDCAEVVWQFLGLSIPEWSLLCFVFLGLLSGLHFAGRRAESRV